MGISNKEIMSSFVAFALMTAMSSAHAVLFNFELTGTIDFADTGNDFGLNDNDSILATGTFDDSSLTGSGIESIVLSGINSLSLTVGTQSFTDADDTGGTGFPKLVFDNGSFSYLDFNADVGSFGFFSAYPCGATCFEGEDDFFNIIEGTWTNYTATVVPVPAAVWLFGSGLIGLVGIARRKRTS